MCPIRSYDEGDPKESSDVVDDVTDLDNPDLDNPDDIDPRDTDDDEPSDDGTPDDRPAELDDDAILKVLEGKGIKSDSLGKIQAVLNDNPALAKKHQSLTTTMKAVRAKLEADGINPDVFLGEAVSGYDGKEPSKSKPKPIPPGLQGYKPEQLEALGEAIDHFTGGSKAIEKKLEEYMPAIISAVTSHLDFTTFAKSKGENPDELKEKLQKVANEHGITGRSEKTLALLYKLADEELRGAVEDLSSNEDDVHTKTPRGTPPPRGRDRKLAPEKTTGLTDDEWRKRHEKEFKKP